MNIEIVDNLASVRLSVEESRWLSIAILEGTFGEEKKETAIVINKEQIEKLSDLLYKAKGLSISSDEEIQLIEDDGGMPNSCISMRRSDTCIVLTMEKWVSRQLALVMQRGYIQSHGPKLVKLSRSDYNLRTNLSRPVVEKIVNFLINTESGSMDVSLDKGNDFNENPPRGRPPKGSYWKMAYIVIRTDEYIEIGEKKFTVVSAWLDRSHANSECKDLEIASDLSDNRLTRSQYSINVAALTVKPKSLEKRKVGKDQLFLVGRIIGQDIGDQELLPSSLWWIENDAWVESLRLGNAESFEVSSHYGIWTTYMRDECIF